MWQWISHHKVDLLIVGVLVVAMLYAVLHGMV